MTKINCQILIVIIFFILSSCKSNIGFRTYKYNNEVNFDTINESNQHTLQNYYTHKLIVILNDSTLNYTVNLGHIKTGATINYKIENNILMVDTVDVNKQKDFHDQDNRIFGVNFIFSNDSLIDKSSGEKYYLTKK